MQQLQQKFGSLYAKRVLAPIAFESYAPAYQLLPFVSEYWQVKTQGQTFSSTQYGDGGMGLVFDLLHPELSVFQGAQTKPRHMSFERATQLLGMRFVPGGASLFFPGFQEHKGGEVLLSDLNYPLFNRLNERVQLAGDIGCARQQLDNLLLAFCVKKQPVPVALKPLFSLLLPRHQPLTIEGVANRVGISQRQLNRLFQELVGYTPKQLGKLFRVDACRRMLSAPVPGSNQDLIYELGYYDQAHFIREFRSHTHSTPNAYRRRKQLQLWAV